MPAGYDCERQLDEYPLYVRRRLADCRTKTVAVDIHMINCFFSWSFSFRNRPRPNILQTTNPLDNRDPQRNKLSSIHPTILCPSHQILVACFSFVPLFSADSPPLHGTLSQLRVQVRPG
jgi:hypothetical protein